MVTNNFEKEFSKDKLSHLHPHISMRNLHPHCSLHTSQGANKENLLNNQELPQLGIISFIPVTLMCYSGVLF